jgi:hypothetical protein
MIKNYRNVVTPISFYGQSPNTAVEPSFNPIDIGNIDAWYKADSLTASSGDYVSTWNDSSGNGKNAIGFGSNNGGTYITSSVNGYPAIAFDGSNYYKIGTSNGNVNFTSGASIFWVMNVSAVMPANSGYFAFSVAGGNDYEGGGVTLSGGYTGGTYSPGIATAWRGEFAPSYNITTDHTDAWFNWNYRAIDAGSGNTQIITRKNSTELETKTNNGSPAFNASYATFGARFAGGTFNTLFSGSMAEIIIYSVDIGASNSALVETYLQTKYNL